MLSAADMGVPWRTRPHAGSSTVSSGISGSVVTPRPARDRSCSRAYVLARQAPGAGVGGPYGSFIADAFCGNRRGNSRGLFVSRRLVVRCADGRPRVGIPRQFLRAGFGLRCWVANLALPRRRASGRICQRDCLAKILCRADLRTCGLESPAHLRTIRKSSGREGQRRWDHYACPIRGESGGAHDCATGRSARVLDHARYGHECLFSRCSSPLTYVRS